MRKGSSNTSGGSKKKSRDQGDIPGGARSNSYSAHNRNDGRQTGFQQRQYQHNSNDNTYHRGTSISSTHPNPSSRFNVTSGPSRNTTSRIFYPSSHLPTYPSSQTSLGYVQYNYKRVNLPPRYYMRTSENNFAIKIKGTAVENLNLNSVGKAAGRQLPFPGKLQQELGKNVNNDVSSLEPKIDSTQVSTFVTENPTLTVMTSGTNLEDHVKPWCCFGSNSWNGRNFAHELTTNLSSPSLHTIQSDNAAKTDFVSDWNNVKTLMKAPITKEHISFVIHRTGKAVNIDQLDLFQLDAFENFLKFPAELNRFVNVIITDDKEKEKIRKEGKSNQEVLDKEAFHRILHCSMGTPMQLKKEIQSEFLHSYKISTEKETIFHVGCNIPLFMHTLEDKENQQELRAGSGAVTVRARNAPPDNWDISVADAYDMWLDNKMTGSSDTLLVNHASSIVTGTKWLKTEDLPKIGMFNGKNYFEQGEELLLRISELVKDGHVYWLYRAPGSEEINLYNLSSITEKLDDLTPSPVIGNWKIVSPFSNYFASCALLKYSACLSEVFTEALVSEGFFQTPKDILKIEDVNVNPSNKKLSRIVGIKSKNDKLDSLTDKFDTEVKRVKKYFNDTKTENWIESVEHIRSDDPKAIVNCIREVYETAQQTTPVLRRELFKHAVKHYYPACSKLVRTLRSSKEQCHFWDNPEPGKLLLNSAGIVCSILQCISNWHSQVPKTVTFFPKTSDWEEWQYIGSRMYVLHADTLFSIIAKMTEGQKQIVVHADEDFPKDYYFDRLIALYLRAIELVPSAPSIRVSECFVANNDPTVIYQKNQLEEIHIKTASSYLRKAVHCLNFPSFYEDVVLPCLGKGPSTLLKGKTASSNKEGSDSYIHAQAKAALKGIKEKSNNHYRNIEYLLNECIKHALKSGRIDELISGIIQTTKAIRAQVRTIRIYLDNCDLDDHFQLSESLTNVLDHRFLSLLPNDFMSLSNGNDKYQILQELTKEYFGGENDIRQVFVVKKFQSEKSTKLLETFAETSRLGNEIQGISEHLVKKLGGDSIIKK